MKSLQLQIQPDLSPALDATKMANRVRALVKKAPFPVRVRITKGKDEVGYINVQFFTDEPKKLWSVLRGELRKNKDLESSSIIVCEGKTGWDDYLLLHHFDRAEALDEL